ncbi:uncharacterized protein LOC135122219 [Zophobas morio]|uniref:uncharacterized protein LOC135122219 n=1 Tax=Zophobas morio TaxID=2755281 RepID=UPI003083A119
MLLTPYMLNKKLFNNQTANGKCYNSNSPYHRRRNLKKPDFSLDGENIKGYSLGKDGLSLDSELDIKNLKVERLPFWLQRRKRNTRYIISEKLTLLLEQKKLQEAEIYLETSLKQTRTPPDTALYNILLAGYCANYCWNKAEAIFRKLLKSNLANDATFLILLNAYASSECHTYEDALKLVNKATTFLCCGLSVYNTLIKVAIFKADNPYESVKNIMETLKQRSVKPDHITYSQVLRMLLKQQKFNEAFDLLNKLRKMRRSRGTSCDFLYYFLEHCRNETSTENIKAVINLFESDLSVIFFKHFWCMKKFCT